MSQNMADDQNLLDASQLVGADARTLADLNKMIATIRPLPGFSSSPVPGEGPVGARIAFVGEQPGDQEDLQGKPFVGPAGQLLNRAMADAGIKRKSAYITNAVKHFKFEQRGKRRIHQKPTAGDVTHYRWWLDQELKIVQPRIVVALGATAVLALAGKALPIKRNRGRADFNGRRGFITVHPSYLLRVPDRDAKEQAFKDFVDDLKDIRELSSKR
jgi:uracil-DNA glycosylase family protein